MARLLPRADLLVSFNRRNVSSSTGFGLAKEGYLSRVIDSQKGLSVFFRDTDTLRCVGCEIVLCLSSYEEANHDMALLFT